jgi:hypothetical protein
LNYQSAARLSGRRIAFYHDSAHERLDRVFGFMVNVGWVQRSLLLQLITQSAQLAAGRRHRLFRLER